jgi:serine/threonine-protein kinase RsbW
LRNSPTTPIVNDTPPKTELFSAAVPANLRALEQFVTDFRLHFTSLLAQQDCFAVELLLREALTNAVVHAPQSSPSGRVHCRLRRKGRRLIIAVRDEGHGFDWRAARSHVAGVYDCSGRGLDIFRSYATRVRFNNRGNAIVIIKDL